MIAVVGTDFSPGSATAADIASRLAARGGGALVLVHVVDPLGGLPLHDPGIMDLASRSLRAEASRLRVMGIAPIEELLVGLPEEGLREAAARHRADLVLLGAFGRNHRPERPGIGAVAERTAETSTVPVLVIRDGGPLGGWLSGERTLRVLVGTDLTATSDAALRWAAALRTIGPIDLLAAHAYIPSLEHRRLGLEGPDGTYDRIPEVEAVLARDLGKRLALFRSLAPYRLVLRGAYSRSATTVVATAMAESADLVVLGSHQRHGLQRAWYGSVSQEVLHTLPMTVACVPFRAPESHALARSEIQTVLVPTDFSEHAPRAVALAYAIAAKGSAVHILHVAAEPLTPERLESLQAAARGLVPEGASGAGIATVVDVLHARDVAEAICQAAERTGADVVCVASHGRSGVKHAMLGSVAEELVRRSPRPVLVVRAPRET